MAIYSPTVSSICLDFTEVAESRDANFSFRQMQMVQLSNFVYGYN